MCAKAKFTKVEYGLDKFAKEKAFGGAGEHPYSFYLCTGGTEEDIKGMAPVADGTEIFCN